MKILNTAVMEIQNDRINGASYLTDRALETIKNVVQTSEAQNSEEFLQEISALTAGLMECRPTMASIGNCSSRFKFEVQKYHYKSPDLNSLRDFSLTILQKIKDDFTQARLGAVVAGAGLIVDRDLIMTCSYSSTVVQTIACAYDQGKLLKILIARSQESPEDIAYGYKLASEFSALGIEYELFTDASAGEKAKGAAKIIVGADAILPDGSLLNGYPTNELALAAKAANIPFYTVCESHKFLSRDLTEPVEKGFTLVRPHLITGIACEKGIITANQVHQLIT